MWEIFECLDIKYGSCKKRLFAELVFACENDIWYTNKTLFVDKQGNIWKYGLPYSEYLVSNYIIPTFSLLIMFIVLVATIFISCY